MNADKLRNNILAVLSIVRDDAEKLQKINEFLMNEIYEEPQPEEIPVKYRKVVHDIAENIDCGMVCFFNPRTLELEEMPKEFLCDPDEFELVIGESWNESYKHETWEHCITIEPRESHEGFKIMERFIDEIDNEFFKREVVGVLNRKHPFANFKALVEGSKYRQKWFDFKQSELERLVWDEISWQLKSNET